MPIVKGLLITQRFPLSPPCCIPWNPLWSGSHSFSLPQLSKTVRSYRENNWEGQKLRQVANNNLISYPNPCVISELHQEWWKNPWASKRCTWDFFFLFGLSLGVCGLWLTWCPCLGHWECAGCPLRWALPQTRMFCDFDAVTVIRTERCSPCSGSPQQRISVGYNLQPQSCVVSLCCCHTLS